MISYFNCHHSCYDFEHKTEVTPRLTEKAPRKLAFASLKRPWQAAIPGLPIDAPSVLYLIQSRIGGDQRTSLLIVGFERLILTSNDLRMEKSVIDELVERFEALSEIEAPDRTKLKVDLIVKFLLLNLLWFLQYHMVLKQWIMADKITNLHWGGPASIYYHDNIQKGCKGPWNIQNVKQTIPNGSSKSTFKE